MSTHEHAADAIRSYPCDPELAQDIADGAALRRLREALPRKSVCRVWLSPTSDALVVVLRAVSGSEMANGTGTIAEAADACREGLP